MKEIEIIFFIITMSYLLAWIGLYFVMVVFYYDEVDKKILKKISKKSYNHYRNQNNYNGSNTSTHPRYQFLPHNINHRR